MQRKMTSDVFNIPKIIEGYLGKNEKNAKDNKDQLVPLGRLAFSFLTDETFRAAHQLADCAVSGKPVKFKNIVQSCPKALLYPIERAWSYGKMKIRATPYQFLIFEDDNYIKDKQDKTFLQIAREYLSVEEIKQQEEKWFKDWDEKAHVAELKTEFDKVAKVFDEYSYETQLGTKQRIITDQQKVEDQKLDEAICNFKQYLENVATRITKKNCIPQLWNYAVQFYTPEKFKNYGDNESDKNKFICRFVLGTIDLYLPAWAMQMLAYGISRSINFEYKVPRVQVSSYYKYSFSYDESSLSNTVPQGLGYGYFMNRLQPGTNAGKTDWVVLDIATTQCTFPYARPQQTLMPVNAQKSKGCVML